MSKQCVGYRYAAASQVPKCLSKHMTTPTATQKYFSQLSCFPYSKRLQLDRKYLGSGFALFYFPKYQHNMGEFQFFQHTISQTLNQMFNYTMPDWNYKSSLQRTCISGSQNPSSSKGGHTSWHQKILILDMCFHGDKIFLTKRMPTYL